MKKKKYIIPGVILAGFIGVATSNLEWSPDKVYAEEIAQGTTALQVKEFFTQQFSTEYDVMFKIPTADIESYETNGGQYQSSSLDKAFDNSLTTHWETKRSNSSSFKNYIEVTFNESKEFNRIVYKGRTSGAPAKGYPTKFEVYAATSDTGAYQLVGQGTSPSSTKRMEFRMPNNVTAKKVKFVFVEAKDGWASAGDLGFYKEDVFLDNVDNLFTDKTYTKLASFVTEDLLSQMESLVQTHPMKSNYESVIQTARNVFNGEVNEIKNYVLDQRGFANSDAWNTGRDQCYQLSMHLPTGLYYKPGETFILDVEVDNTSKLPSILFGQNYNVKGGDQVVELKPGRNVIKVRDDIYGGGVYFINRYTAEEQGAAPKISIKQGGAKLPVFTDGDNEEEFKEELRAYLAEMRNVNVDGKIIMPNMVQLVSEHTMVLGLATAAETVYLNESRSPQYAVSKWEEMLMSDYALLGYTEDATEQKNRIPKNRLLCRTTVSGMWAGGGQIGLSSPKELLSGNFGWGVFHETGHVVEINKLRVLELTNNIFSLANQEKYGQSIRIEDQSILNNYWAKYTSGKVLGFVNGARRADSEVNFSGWEAHLILWQLRAGFGYDVFTDIYKAARNTNIKGAKSVDYWAQLASDATGYDMGAYFKHMGMDIQDSILAYTAQYPALDIALQYADGKARTYVGEGFPTGYQSQIAAVEKASANSVKITADTTGVENDFMGFEVYRDGQLIGYTNKDFYVDKNISDITTVNYTIKAYDRKLKPALESSDNEINVQEPLFKVSEATVYHVLGVPFNLSQYVTATNYDGTQNLNDYITVDYSNVDVNTRGQYTVAFSVTDENGNRATQSIEVYVGADLVPEFASDIVWQKATAGWGSVRKDTNTSGGSIKLTVNGQVTEFTKGIGAHARSEIVYNVGGQGYKTFTSWIGIDHSQRNTIADVIFQVYVDGVLVKQQQMMGRDAAQLIEVDIAGASEVKLVVDANGTNGNDHAVWADAKFLKAVGWTADTLANKEIEQLRDIVQTVLSAEDVDVTLLEEIYAGNTVVSEGYEGNEMENLVVSRINEEFSVLNFQGNIMLRIGNMGGLYSTADELMNNDVLIGYYIDGKSYMFKNGEIQEN